MVVAHHREQFNCQACKFHRHCDASNPSPFPVWVIPEIGLESRTCLLPMVDESSRQLLRLYGHYKNGLLPFAGGILDQPAVFGEAMELIELRISQQKPKGEG